MQEGREYAEPGGDDDQHQDCAEACAVRREQRTDAAQVCAPLGRVGRPLGRLVGCVPERAQLELGATVASDDEPNVARTAILTSCPRA